MCIRDRQVTITIIADGDATPSLSINDVSTTNESNTATNMTVTLSAVSKIQQIVLQSYW